MLLGSLLGEAGDSVSNPEDEKVMEGCAVNQDPAPS